MIKRHFNAFLKNLGIKQLFWSIVKKECVRLGINYQHKKSELYSYNRDIIIRAFCWVNYPEPPDSTWPDIHIKWNEYVKSHDMFI